QGHLHPVRCFGQRRLGNRVGIVRIIGPRRIVVHVGQHDRQLVLGQRDGVAVLVVDDGERLAPVALSGEQPVTQFVLNGSVAVPLFLRTADATRLGLANVETVQAGLFVGRVDGDPVTGVRPIGKVIGRLYGSDDIQPELRRVLPVTLVLTGYRHDRAGTVVG